MSEVLLASLEAAQQDPESSDFSADMLPAYQLFLSHSRKATLWLDFRRPRMLESQARAQAADPALAALRQIGQDADWDEARASNVQNVLKACWTT